MHRSVLSKMHEWMNFLFIHSNEWMTEWTFSIILKSNWTQISVTSNYNNLAPVVAKKNRNIL